MTNLTHNSFLCIYFNSLHVSSNPVLIIRRINCINTTSGICHSVSVTVSCAGRKFEQPRAHHQENQFYQYNLWYMSLCLGDRFVYRSESSWPFRVQVGKFLSDLHTKRSTTHSDICQKLYWYNWFSWWWAQGCSKHVQNWNKYIEKKCASSWSFTKNHKEMQGQ